MGWLPFAGIAAIVLVGFFDNFSQFPIVAPYARSLGAAPWLVGLVVATFSLTNLVGNLLAGHLLDRYGRKRLLIAGLLASAGAVSLYAAVDNAPQLLVVRAVHGLTAAVLAPAAFTLLGDLFPAERRGRAMGASGTLIALAALIAPPISGVIRDRWGFDGVFFAVGGLFLLTALGAGTLVRESYRPPAGESPPAGMLLQLIGRRNLLPAYAAATVLSLGLGILVTDLPLRLADLGSSGGETGLAFSAFALTAMFTMVGLTARLGGPGRWRAVSGAGLGVVGLALVLLPGQEALVGIVAAMAVYGLGFGLVFPSANAQVADATRKGERGTAFGAFYAFYSVGVIMGAALTGMLADAGQVFTPFYLGAVASLAAAAALIWVKQASSMVISEN